MEFNSQSVSKPEDLRQYFVKLEQQFRTIQFTKEEWKAIHQNIVTDALPLLSSNITEHSDIVRYSIELFCNHIDFESVGGENWEAYFKLAKSVFHVGKDNRIRIDGLELIQKLLTHGQNGYFAKEKLDDFILNGLLRVLTKTSRPMPTLIQAINSTLGLLCEFHPKVMRKHESTVKRCLMSQLMQEINSTTKEADISIMDGCLRGFNHYLVNFGINAEEKSKLYGVLKTLSFHPGEGGRRFHHRAGLSLFARQCHIWKDNLINYEDCKLWFRNLKIWAEKVNADDHKLGWKCLDAFLKNISGQFVKTEKQHENSFHYLVGEFKNLISKSVSKKGKILGILGYSSLAFGCKQYMGPEMVETMLESLLDKIYEVYFLNSQDKDEWIIFFPNHVKAIGDIIQFIAEPKIDDILRVESLVVELIVNYPKLPPQYHGFSVEAFWHSTKHHLNVRNIVLQGILHSCSFPVVTEVDDAQGVVSTKNFARFWKDVCAHDEVNDAVILAVLEIINRLNFDTDTFEILYNERKEIIEETLDNSLTQVIKEEIGSDVGMAKKVKRPKKVKDHTVLANLVHIFHICRMDHKWLGKLLRNLMAKSTEYPEVSGFYKLLSKTFDVASVLGLFQDDREMQKISTYFFVEAIDICQSFEHELLLSFLKLITKIPIEFVKDLLPNLSVPMVKVFRQKNQLIMVEKGLETIDAWSRHLGHDVMNDFLIEVIPYMKLYLEKDTLELLEESIKEKTAHKKGIEVVDDPILERIQRKLLLFFGGIKSDLHYLLHPSAAELSSMSVAWDMEQKLDFDIPFPDLNCKIYLDLLLPRVVELSLNSTHRRTRIAACETLHVLVIYMIGKEASSTSDSFSNVKLYRKVFPVMLKLAGDEDTVIGACLFEKLMIQLTHHLTRNAKGTLNKGVIVLLDSLLDALRDHDDKILRQMAKKMIYEYLKWSIKQQKSLSDENKAAKLLITRLYSMWLHPDYARRVAASAAFNSIYTIFREKESLVQIYTLEIVTHAMASLEMNHGMDCQETNDCINHLMRILKAKEAFFHKVDDRRRIPSAFTSGHNSGTLADLLFYLVPLTAKKETELRHKAIESMFYLSLDISQDIPQFGYTEQLLAVINRDNEEMKHYLCSLELAIWLCEQKVFSTSQVNLKMQPLLTKLLDRTLLQEEKNIKEENDRKKMVGAIVVQYLKWLTRLDFNQMDSDDKNLITQAIFDPSMIGFDARHHLNLRRNLEFLIQKLPSAFLTDLFQSKANQSARHFNQEEFSMSLLETLEGLNFIKKYANVSIQFDESPSDDVIVKHIDGIAREYCVQMVDLMAFMNKDRLKGFLDNGKVFNNCEDKLFAHCIQHEFKDLSLSLSQLAKLMRFVASKKDTLPVSAVRKWMSSVLKNWCGLNQISEPKVSLYLTKYFLQMGGQPNKDVQNWYFSLLRNENIALKVKVLALDYFLAMGNGQEQNVTIEHLIQQLPLTSDELRPGTEISYFALLHKLCQLLQSSSLVVLFTALLKICSREDNHPLNEQLRATLLQVKNKLPLLNIAFDYSLGGQIANFGEDKSKRVVIHLLIPLLEGSNNLVVLEFYTKTIASLLEIILEGNEAKVTLALKMIAQLYVKATKDVVHGKGSSVTCRAFQFLKDRHLNKGDYSGKEMSQFLVKELKSLRSDRGKEMELRCEAFNTLMAIFTSIQDTEKLYYNFLFKEDPGARLWESIIDCSQKWTFSIESEDVPQKRNFVVAIKKAIIDESAVTASKAHFLSDCTLSQEVSTFDFHDSIVKSQTEKVENVKEVITNGGEMNLLELEQDCIGQHRCFANIVALFKFMDAKAIVKMTDDLTDETCIGSLKKRLNDPMSPSQVKLFILKLILNCPDVFKPWAKHFIGPILRAILDSRLWNGQIINYFSLDLWTMLVTSWTNVLPNDPELGKLASEGLCHLCEAAVQGSRREIMRYILDLIFITIEKWKSCLTLPYSKLSTYLNHDNVIVPIQVLGFMFSFGLGPAGDSRQREHFYQEMAPQMHSGKKEIFQTTAEVLGLSLKHYAEKQLPIELETVKQSALLHLKKLNGNGAAMKKKFFHSLFMVFQHYPDIVTHFASQFMYNLSQLPAKDILVQCVEMLQGAMPVIKQNVQDGGSWTKEFAMMKLRNFLHGQEGDVQVQLAALAFVEKAMGFIISQDKKLAQELTDDLQRLLNHPWTDVRKKVLTILQSMSLDGLSQATKLLMSGLSDNDPSIVQSTIDFVETHQLQRLSQTPLRVKHLLSQVLQSNCKEAFVSVFCDLTLAHTRNSPRIDQSLFDPLEELWKFTKMNINTSWRSQFDHSIEAPLFAETLSSSQNSSPSSIGTPMIQATQTTLEFSPTQTFSATAARPFLSSIVASTTQSRIDEGQFKVTQMDRSFGQPLSRTNIDGENKNQDPPSSVRIGKRFTMDDPNIEDTKSRFAKQYQRKVSRLESLEKEKRGRRQAQVMLKRTYKEGELPDISISSQDIIAPLRALCYRDGQVAELLNRLILSGLIKDHHELKPLILAQLLSPDLMSQPLARSLMEICCTFDSGDLNHLEVEKLVLVGKKFNLIIQSILILEKSPKERSNGTAKKRRTDRGEVKHFPRETIFGLMNLYQSLNDHASARGLYLQESLSENLSQTVLKAMSHDAMAHFRTSKKCYRSLMQKETNEELKRFWIESHLNALEKLSDWEEIGQETGKLRPFESDWAQSIVLPKFVSGALHWQIEKEDGQNALRNFFKGDPELMKRFPLETASVFMLSDTKDKEKRVAHWNEAALKETLRQWRDKNPFHIDANMKIVQSMQKVANFSSEVEFSRLSQQFGNDLQANDHLLCLWKISKGNNMDSNDLMKANVELLKRCHSLKQFDVAVKLMKSLVRDVANAKSTPSFFLYEIKTTVEQCSILEELSPLDKFKHFHRCLMKCNHESLVFPQLDVRDQALLRASLLENMAQIARGENLTRVLDALGEEKKQHLLSILNGEENFALCLQEKAIDELKSASSQLAEDGLLTLAKYCYQLTQHFPTRVDEALIVCLLEAHVGSIRRGSMEAVKLLPKIFLLIETHFEGLNFSEKDGICAILQNLPPWTVLPWSNQLLSLLQTDVINHIFYPLVTSLARNFPQALSFSFNFVSEEVQEKFPDLKRLLKPNSLTQKLVSSLQKVSLPSTRLADFIQSLAKSQNVEASWQYFMADNFGRTQSNTERLFFNLDLKRTLMDFVKKLQSCTDSRQKSQIVNEMKSAVKKHKDPQVQKLSDLSPSLAHFSANFGALDVPGQYDMRFHEISSTVKIAGFKDAVQVFKSIRKPIKITMIGDDGKDYDFIVKGGEDIRQDQRVEQVFGICNNLAGASMVTYNVIPINPSLGLIQFVPDTKTLSNFISTEIASQGAKISDLFVRDFAKLKSLLRVDSAKIRQSYKNQVIEGLLKNGFQLRDAFLKNSYTSEGFFHLRKNFMISHGEVALMGYLLGLGDRHAQNMLISLSSGKSIAIDFGYSFGSAFLLQIPELAPFRLTPTIQGLMYPFKDQGIFKDTMVNMLQKLKANQDILMAALSIFIRDPSMDWIKESERLKSVQDMTGDRIRTVQRKLDCEDPAKVISDTLEKYYAPMDPNRAQITPLLKALLLEHRLDVGELNPDGIATSLINIASDPAILSRAYIGWSPYI